MYISGFTFIRNALKLDYPVREAILSVLPLVDEMVVAVGSSEDTTRELIESLGPKIRIIDTVWDDTLREGGKVLAEETNKALDAVNEKTDWCIYIQGDECIHEQYYDEIRAKMEKYKDHKQVEGLLFDYAHFFGSYDYLADSRSWYKKEIRIIKKLKGIRSYKDAQGFRIKGKKLRVKQIAAEVYHYGWVRHPKYQMAKLVEANKLWHSDEEVAGKFKAEEVFDYSTVDSVKTFEGTHPEVMQARIDAINWKFDRDPSVKTFSIKVKLLYAIEKYTGWRVGEYKNYKLLRGK